jgi:AraC-like DNA-binding protein
MIEDGNSSLMSMEGIGKSAGFAYRSTFYSLFKKETGLTPVEYFEKLNKNK